MARCPHMIRILRTYILWIVDSSLIKKLVGQARRIEFLVLYLLAAVAHQNTNGNYTCNAVRYVYRLLRKFATLYWSKRIMHTNGVDIWLAVYFDIYIPQNRINESSRDEKGLKWAASSFDYSLRVLKRNASFRFKSVTRLKFALPFRTIHNLNVLQLFSLYTDLGWVKHYDTKLRSVYWPV